MHSMIPFLTTGKKKELSALSQGSSVHPLWTSPSLLTDWQTPEWRQLRKTPAIRLDMKGRWCVLSTQLVFFPQPRSQILVMKVFLQRRSYPSPQFPLSSSNSTQAAALKLCKNDIFILWWLVPVLHMWQAAAPSPCWLLAWGDAPAKPGGRERDAWDSTHLITVTNREKPRKMREERIRNLKRVTGQVKYTLRRRKSEQNHHQTELL